MKKEIVTLKCGMEATITRYKRIETISVSVYDFYSGYGDLLKMSEMLKELHESGYKSLGCFITYGYYESVDDLVLSANRNIKRNKT